LIDDTSVEWVYWRPVKHGLARGLTEVCREWSVEDLIEAHEVMNLENDIEEMGRRESERRSKSR
jgi:hypothetical protein